MRRVDIVRHPSTEQHARLIEFLDQQTARRRQLDPTAGRPVSDHAWLDLQSSERSDTVATIVVESSSAELQPAQLRTIALGLVTAVNDGWGLEVVVDTDLEPAQRAALLIDVADTALDARSRDGGGVVTWWLDDAPPEAIELAANFGLAPTRVLHEMRRPLPHPEHATIDTRPFEPDRDAERWLAVNNRAFATHPEQGGWTIDTLRKRFDEPWFDPDGFRILEVDGQMAGFCWTKVDSADPAVEPDQRLGEIYVIAVDPAFHGRRLGWELTLAGLDWLSGHGIGRATLYVDGTNHAAVGLYRHLGFDVHRTRHAFAGTLSPI